MNSRLTELVGITLLGAAERLLKWNRSGRVTWRHITENGRAEYNTEEDFEKFIKALSDNDFQGTFIICIVNGSAMGYSNFSNNPLLIGKNMIPSSVRV